MIETQLEQDIKTAMLAGDKLRVLTLRTLKSAILSVKVAKGTRESVMADNDVIVILSKESKKRQESADLYIQGGNQARSDAELLEKSVIANYLPTQLTEEELSKIIDEVIVGSAVPAQMGPIIGQVKAKAGPAADGSLIAKLVKEKLSKWLY